MEVLKRSIIIVCALFLTIGLQAQNLDQLKEAFASSITFEKEGEYTKAIESIKRAYQEESYETNLRLGWLTYMSGLFTESVAYYQKAIALQPLSLEAKLGIVYPASALGNWDQVVKQYHDILTIDPQNTTANYRLGSIYYGREEFEMSEKHFERVLNLYPFDYDTMILMAWTKFKLGKSREAKVLFQKCLLWSPEDESALEGLNSIK